MILLLCSLSQVYYSDFNPYQPLSSPKVWLMGHAPTLLAGLIQGLSSSLLCSLERSVQPEPGLARQAGETAVSDGAVSSSP